MKVLIVGLGSAGQRHVRNLKRILGNEVEFIAYRVRKLSRTFDDSLNVLEGIDVNETYHIRQFENLDEALAEKPDVAFVTNPNSMHIPVAMQIAKAGVDIFLEKPVSNSLDGIEELAKTIREKKLILYVGYQMRLHPCLMRLKQDVDNGVLGQIVYVDCQMGELLSGMHRYEDYRQMNESKKSTGGGVVLCQIHELDYLYWIFGMPIEVFSIGNKYSNLEIEVEDSVTTLCRYEEKGKQYPVVIHQDFLQAPATRKCKVIGTNGQIEVNLLKNQYSICLNGVEETSAIDEFTRNDMFMEEIRCFLKYVKTRKQETMTLEDGLGSLKIALAIKKSMSTNERILLGENEVCEG